MDRIGGHAIACFYRVRGDLVVFEVNLNECLSGVQFEFLANILMWHRVMVLVELHVVVDVDLDSFNFDKPVWLTRQWFQCWSVK